MRAFLLVTFVSYLSVHTMDTFTLTSTVAHYPPFAYELVKNTILGHSYQLSLTFVGTRRAQSLNRAYRKKDYAPNVLSFPLTPTTGEIIICPAVTKSEAAAYALSSDGYIVYLFIHGLLHLKGLDHSDEMDSLELQYVRRFAVS